MPVKFDDFKNRLITKTNEKTMIKDLVNNVNVQDDVIELTEDVPRAIRVTRTSVQNRIHELNQELVYWQNILNDINNA